MRDSAPSFALDSATATFEISNYNWARPFSNFLPGIAGRWGVPAWAFWVNRGQAIAGLGAEDRDGQVLEFMSFNKACGRVMVEGFRTFLRVDGAATYEPFRRTDNPAIVQMLRVRPAEFELEERNEELGIEVTVAYHTLPNRRVAALVRSVAVRDLSGRNRTLEWLDGAPRVLPYGIDQHGIKVIPRHIEAMIGVSRRGGAALFRLKQSAADSARIEPVRGANFYWSSATSDDAPPIVDPTAVFGDPFSFDRALVFDHGGVRAVAEMPAIYEGRTPCAFTASKRPLAPDEAVELVSVMGRVEREEDIDALTALDRADLKGLRAENRRLVDAIADLSGTVSSTPAFDAYCRQNFLDNVIRGGLPLVIEAGDAVPRVYAYSHQNGDLERDYHQFGLTPTYFSQGMSHYRNTAQNRRSDAWFYPGLGDANLKLFFGLIQLDGYNPLEILPETYRVAESTKAAEWTEKWAPVEARGELVESMEADFSIGQLAMWLEDAMLQRPPPQALGEAFSFLAPEEVGGIHAGFWIDHWHYALDLLDSHLSVYPDHLERVLLDEGYTWFDNPDVVVPRHRRVAPTSRGLRQLGAVDRDEEKTIAIAARTVDRHRARTASGDILESTLLVKLLLLATTRLATLDPSGLGIDMEAGKPGWNDSLNGLPGLFGSGLSETVELRRLVRLLGDWLEQIEPAVIEVFEELAELITDLTPMVAKRAAGELTAAAYWDAANDFKEKYRETVRLGVSGERRSLPLEELTAFLKTALAFLDDIFLGSGRAAVLGADGVPHTYFVHNPQGTDEAVPERFERADVGTFLEGPMHWLREFPEDARSVYNAVRTSSLYDAALGMYKSSGPMGAADPELGRAVGAYPPGWLENESIYTHMEYKYLLEVLRSGLVKEFWEDAANCLVPFLDPATYGRSPLEGSSFIVSSAHSDRSEHGRGYQPRLSGMTAEFISIWLLATVGRQPFRMNDGVLEFAPQPMLPGWLFTAAPGRASFIDETEGPLEVEVPAGSFTFRLGGGGTCVYINSDRRDTYGPDGVGCAAFDIEFRNEDVLRVEGPVLRSDAAAALRAGNVRHLRVLLR